MSPFAVVVQNTQLNKSRAGLRRLSFNACSVKSVPLSNPTSLLLSFLLSAAREKFHTDMDQRHCTNPFWSFGLGLITGLVFIPIGVGLTTILMKFLYKNRASYYNEPEKLAKRQRVIRDTVILMFVGAIIGAVIGFFFSDIFY